MISLTRKRPLHRLTKRELRHLLTGIAFISLWIVGFLVLTLYPIVISLYIASLISLSLSLYLTHLGGLTELRGVVYRR